MSDKKLTTAFLVRKGVSISNYSFKCPYCFEWSFCYRNTKSSKCGSVHCMNCRKQTSINFKEFALKEGCLRSEYKKTHLDEGQTYEGNCPYCNHNEFVYKNSVKNPYKCRFCNLHYHIDLNETKQ